MADADEDAIPSASTNDAEDLEDETQDFRFLSQFTATSRTGQTVIPKRGTKDFEPNPTRSQASALDASRLAMHTALSSIRIHSGKNHVVGRFLPDERAWRWDEDVTGGRNARCVVVDRFKSMHTKNMGQADRYNRMWLLPEEALWLLERGSLDIRWPNEDHDDEHNLLNQETRTRDEANPPVVSETGDVDAQDQDQDQDDAFPETQAGELPMSVQGAYSSFIGKDGLTLERYIVYAGLKRTGYVVQRAPTWHDTDPPPANGHNHDHASQQASLQPTTLRPTPISSTPQPRSPVSNIASLIHRLVSYLFEPRRDDPCPSLGPLVAPGLYRNYLDIFRALALIPYHEPISTTTTSPTQPPPQTQTQSPQAPYRIHFHVWKPSTSGSYKKTSPPPPDYRICVIDARTAPAIPSLAQLGPLLDSQPDDVLQPEKAGRLENRIKHGRKNVLLAIVDMGVVSYLRLSDACFGAEKLFEEKMRSGAKGGRGWKRRPSQGRKPGQTR